MRLHQFVQHSVVPVTLIEDDQGNPIPFVEPGKEPQVTLGCFACSLGIDQAWEQPECPGVDVEMSGEQA